MTDFSGMEENIRTNFCMIKSEMNSKQTQNINVVQEDRFHRKQKMELSIYLLTCFLPTGKQENK